MRRRRLIGVYRGLLMSIWMPWLRFDVMSAAAARGGATKSLNMRRVHMAKLADHAAQHNRVKSFCCACPKAGESFRRSVALTMVARYARPHVVPPVDGCVQRIGARLDAAYVPTERLGTRCRRRERPAAPETVRQA